MLPDTLEGLTAEDLTECRRAFAQLMVETARTLAPEALPLKGETYAQDVIYALSDSHPCMCNADDICLRHTILKRWRGCPQQPSDVLNLIKSVKTVQDRQRVERQQFAENAEQEFVSMSRHGLRVNEIEFSHSATAQLHPSG